MLEKSVPMGRPLKSLAPWALKASDRIAAAKPSRNAAGISVSRSCVSSVPALRNSRALARIGGSGADSGQGRPILARPALRNV